MKPEDADATLEAEEFRMPWGKFRGSSLGEIQRSYLLWLAENCDDDTIATKADIILRNSF